MKVYNKSPEYVYTFINHCFYTYTFIHFILFLEIDYLPFLALLKYNGYIKIAYA